MSELTDKLYHASPSENTDQWFTWNIYEPLPPKPVFFGTMEEAISVSDKLNSQQYTQKPRSAAK